MDSIEDEGDVVEIAADNVLVIGSGAREHALVWKLSTSHQVEKVFVAPGNAGTDTGNICNVELNVEDHDAVLCWCKENNVNLVVVGPEGPLASGIVDNLKTGGVQCFGPTKAAAQLESSKAFAKEFMDRHNIPTARWKKFTNVKEAEEFIQNAPYKALVVKVSGLAAGKGVVVAKTQEEACQAVRDALEDRKFGEAGSTVIVEELLQGKEISCIAITDGTTVSCFPPARDYKRLEAGDQGPNTGGMGAVCPVLLSRDEMDTIRADILYATVDGMRKEGTPYVGALYAGLMITSEGIKVLEFNCRFGDPETQVLLPLMHKQCDLYSAMKACVEGTLKISQIEIERKSTATAVVCASKGYPGTYNKGLPITGLEKMKELDLQVFHAGTKRTSESIVTNGGRVLTVVCVTSNYYYGKIMVYEGIKAIEYDGKIFRSDITGDSNIKFESEGAGSGIVLGPDSTWFGGPTLSYSDCGVDIWMGDSLVQQIKPLAKSTQVEGCMGELGGFGALFDLKASGFKDPILVSGTDGVGTKLKFAQAMNKHDTIGMDLVAMCVNDVLCHGARPLFFLDYLSSGKLRVNTAKDIVKGIAKGCKTAKCALIGGETAELPGMYDPSTYDMAGFCVGAVERDQKLPKSDTVAPGDVIIGVASSGIHSNGMSMVRRIIYLNGLRNDMCCPWDNTQKLGDVLLTPTRIYVQSVLPLMQAGKIKAAAHITGGGLQGNIARILPDKMCAHLDASKWPRLPVFNWLAKNGNVAANEMARTFNLGLGIVLIVPAELSEAVCEGLVASGEQAYCVGTVDHKQEGSHEVVINNLEEAFETERSKKHRAESPAEGESCKRMKTNDIPKLKVGVLISGKGTNLQALIDHTKSPNQNSQAEIVLVVSNHPDAEGLSRAEAAGIPISTVTIRDYPSREKFDEKIDEELTKAGVEFVCLAGFMRILSGKFVQKWRGRILNIHPSLLPLFKGLNPHKQVLAAGVRVSGCTVHFVEEEVDAGAILLQDTVPVNPGDDEDAVQERVKAKEHEAYPRALELIASGKAKYEDGCIQWC